MEKVKKWLAVLVFILFCENNRVYIARRWGYFMKRMFMLFLACFIAKTAFPQEIVRYPARRGVLYSLLNISTFENLRWENNGNEISGAAVASMVTISFSVGNIREGEIIQIEVWEDTGGEMKDRISTLEGVVKNGKAAIDWVVEFDMSNEDTNYGMEIKRDGFTVLDYIFIAKYENITSQKSALLAVMAWGRQQIINKDTGEPIRNTKYYLLTPDGNVLPGVTDDEGWIKQDNLRIIGEYKLII